MDQPIRIMSLQPALRWQQTMANMVALRQIVGDLAAMTDFVVLPESWAGQPLGTATSDTAAQQTQFLQTLARSCRINVIGGTIEKPTDSGLLQNVTLVINRRGEIVGEYAKRILFGLEQDVRVPGQSSGVFEIDGRRIGVLICADLWRAELVRELIDKVDVVFVPAKTAVPSDLHVEYAWVQWLALALTRAMESGLPIVVSDWATGRHTPKDVDRSIGSPAAGGTDFDRGVLYRRARDPNSSPTSSGPVEPTAVFHTSIAPAVGPGVHFTSGASSICNPGLRPDIKKVQQLLPRGESGYLVEALDPQLTSKFRTYRQSVGLL